MSIGRISIFLCGGMIAVGLWGANPALAQKKSVAEEILDILREENKISQQQYRDLVNKARAEKEQIEAANTKPDPSTFRVFWKEGLNMENADKFKLKIGGRLQNDWAIFDSDEDIDEEFGEIGDGTRFRRARINLEGEIYKNTKFRTEFDFAGGDANFTDVYIEIKDLPILGSYTVGHFKEPFSLEELTSSRFITFMERSLPNVFSPARNTGMMLSNTIGDGVATWAFGAFRDTNNFGEGFGKDLAYNATGRITAVPWFVDKGHQLLHLGFSYSHRFRDSVDLRFQQRPETSFGPRFVDTGNLDADHTNLFNPEVAFVYGPFSVQGEYTAALLDVDGGSNVNLQGYYAQLSYFFTGESRAYKTSSGTFDRVKPVRNFDGKGGWGAWELAVRYSHLDLDDEEVEGGKLDDFTLGLNWHLNPNIRFQLNYIFADRDDIGDSGIFQARFQADF
ncbi:MAG: OprO/OprP family phosphate-selective porin [Candidatus Binatia bacterium]